MNWFYLSKMIFISLNQVNLTTMGYISEHKQHFMVTTAYFQCGIIKTGINPNSNVKFEANSAKHDDAQLACYYAAY